MPTDPPNRHFPPVYKPQPQGVQPKPAAKKAAGPPRPQTPGIYRPAVLQAKPVAIQRVQSLNCCGSRAVMTGALLHTLTAPRAMMGVIQRTGCTVYGDGTSIGESSGVGKGGTGGVSHAEQLAWNSVKSSKYTSSDTILFDVDRPICHLCVTWFEDTLYPVVHGAGKTLRVHVKYGSGPAKVDSTITVTGSGTAWGKVSEEGYYAKPATATAPPAKKAAKKTAKKTAKRV